MRLSTKPPITSPGRTEKFPPPLMRFLRSNGGSKSTRRTSSSSVRSSPMFIRKKNVNANVQEPTSPKVTCMGQVRVKRSQKSSTKKSWAWFSWRSKKKKSLFFCNCCAIRSWFLCCSSQNEHTEKVEETVEVRKDEELTRGEQEEEVEAENESEEEEEERKGFVSSTVATSSSPPKNALFLMRCRSDPCKNSSMLSRFSDSTTDQNYNTTVNAEDIEKPTLEKVEFCESSSSGRSSTTVVKDEVVVVVEQEEKEMPLTLTRCKSEPATSRLMKVDEEKKRNSEFNEKCPSHTLL